MSDFWELDVIKQALEHPELFTDEQYEDLKHTHLSMTSPLLRAAKEAFQCGEPEVAMACAKAFCEKYPLPTPRPDDCVIYCRVSTEQQTRGLGLWRQMHVCTEYAKSKRYNVVAVFSEVRSGADPLPARAQAERMAQARNCKIVCETYDRWSRQGIEDLPPRNLEIASECERQMEEEIKKLFTPAQLYVINSRLPH